MTHRIVNVPELGEPVGYAHAVVAAPGGRLVHLGGQTALDPSGRIQGTTLPAVVRWSERHGFGVQFGLLGAYATHAILDLVKKSSS